MNKIKIYFLEADRPLTKSFKLVNGVLEKSAYPNVYEVTSFEEQVSCISELMDALKKHAAAGRCLLKGALERPLVKESRAGSTNPQAPTQWVCLDLDGVNAPNVDSFLASCGLSGVDYGVQWSASSGLVPGLRCHIFMLLIAPIPVTGLKTWLQSLNLSRPEISKDIVLSSTGVALRYPLDITVCQEDKIIYICPPNLGPGLKDPHEGTRYEVHSRGSPTAKPPSGIPTAGAIRARTEERLALLRASASLPKRRSWSTKAGSGVSYLPNPDQGAVTGQRSERGFTYLNLNGGDSWGYYHPEENATFLYNFKGEPVYKTSELVPDYWRTAQRRTNTGSVLTSRTGAKVYLAFRDFQTSVYYNAIYQPSTDSLRLATAKSEKQLRDFMIQHGQMLGEYIPDWTLTWDPTSRKVLDIQNKVLNTFVPSEIMKLPVDKAVTSVPILTDKVIHHILNYDEDTYSWVINWLAYIYQYRCLSRVGLLTHGTEGTGKGVFYHRIIAPLLGIQNVTSKRLEELESQFNGFVSEKLFVMVDEIQVSSATFHEKVTAKLKNMIVEENISVRELYKPAVMKRNHANFFFASNRLDPLEITPADRRYTVAPPQERPLLEVMTQHDITNELPKESAQFASYLMNYPCDAERAKLPLANDAKRFMIALNRQTIDQVSDALLSGDLQFFVDALPADIDRGFGDNFGEYEATIKYIRLIDMIAATGEHKITREELYILCRHCIGKGVPIGAHKFTTYLRHHRLNLESIWRDGKSVRGLDISNGWKIPAGAQLITSALLAKVI